MLQAKILKYVGHSLETAAESRNAFAYNTLCCKFLRSCMAAYVLHIGIPGHVAELCATARTKVCATWLIRLSLNAKFPELFLIMFESERQNEGTLNIFANTGPT